jgi:hypothetical protein
MSILSEVLEDRIVIDHRLPGHYLSSSSLSRIFTLGAEGFFMVSAFKATLEGGPSAGAHKPAKDAGMKSNPSKSNMARDEELKNALVRNHVGYVTLFGKWADDSGVHEELSVFVPFHNFEKAVFANDMEKFTEFALDLGVQFDQDAIVLYAPESPESLATAEVSMVSTDYTNWNNEPRHKYDVDPIGRFRTVDIEQVYISALLRANNSYKQAAKFMSDDDYKEYSDKKAQERVKKEYEDRKAAGLLEPGEGPPLFSSDIDRLVSTVLPVVGIISSFDRYEGMSLRGQFELLHFLDQKERRIVAFFERYEEWSNRPVKFKGEK